MTRPKKENNIRWVAEVAGVSAATVSNTLNNRSGVSKATREKIQKIISNSVYQRSYRNVNPRMITVITDHLGSWYLADCISGIIEYTSSAGINVNTVIYNATADKPLVEQLRTNRCDGVIIMALGIGKDDLQSIRDMNVPVIMVDDISEDENIGYVNNDSYQGSFDLARHLIGLGHRNIAYLSYYVTLPHQQNTLARIGGWRDALMEAGILAETIDSMLYTALYEDIPHVLKNIIAEHRDVTALMVVDDHMALAVMHACHDLGLRIPEDISITGFDDVRDAQYYFPSLTTARHCAKEIAWKAAKALSDILTGRTDQLLREIVRADVVLRKSTGPVKNK